MLFLHQYPSIWNLPSLSPFCIKVETYLRMVKLPYEIVVENNPKRGPKGKMPVLRDGKNIIPDSSFIIEYLKNNYGNSLDAMLNNEQWAIAHATQRLVEESLYFAILYSRWIDPAGKKIIDNTFRQFFPKPLAGLALAYIRNNLAKQAKAQGIGRHSQKEIYYIGQRDINAIANLLGDKTYYLGDSISTIDSTVYAFLLTILLTPLNNPLQTEVKSHHNLLKYVERMQNTYFTPNTSPISA